MCNLWNGEYDGVTASQTKISANTFVYVQMHFMFLVAQDVRQNSKSTETIAVVFNNVAYVYSN